MPRPNRVILPHVPAHIVQRGHNRAMCFFSDRDFDEYRQVLMETSQQFRVAIHAYVLMTNHVHLLVSASNSTGVSQMMQTLGCRYVRSVNFRRRRTGTLWEGRFKSSVIDSDQYFFTCSRYIELNPLRAHMVQDVGEYRWSSYRHNAHGEHDPLVTPYSLYEGLDASPPLRRRAYRHLFRQPIEAESLERIRQATKRGLALGDTMFVERLEVMSKRRVARGPHGGDRKSSMFQLIASF